MCGTRHIMRYLYNRYKTKGKSLMVHMTENKPAQMGHEGEPI